MSNHVIIDEFEEMSQERWDELMELTKTAGNSEKLTNPTIGEYFTNAEKRVYIAGKMRGLPNYGFDIFDEAKDRARKLGFFVISPADLDRAYAGHWDKFRDLKSTVNRDLAALQSCNAIALLPNWTTSVGAKAELAVAKWLEMEVLSTIDFKPLRTDWG